MSAAEVLRASKARWGSYAIDHDAIDALADLLDALGRLKRLGLTADFDPLDRAIEVVLDRRDALEQAITRKATP